MLLFSCSVCGRRGVESSFSTLTLENRGACVYCLAFWEVQWQLPLKLLVAEISAHIFVKSFKVHNTEKRSCSSCNKVLNIYHSFYPQKPLHWRTIWRKVIWLLSSTMYVKKRWLLYQNQPWQPASQLIILPIMCRLWEDLKKQQRNDLPSDTLLFIILCKAKLNQNGLSVKHPERVQNTLGRRYLKNNNIM